METGEHGLHGVLAVRLVVVGRKPVLVCVTIQPLLMEEPIVLALLLSLRLATPRPAQLQIQVRTFIPGKKYLESQSSNPVLICSAAVLLVGGAQPNEGYLYATNPVTNTYGPVCDDYFNTNAVSPYRCILPLLKFDFFQYNVSALLYFNALRQIEIF